MEHSELHQILANGLYVNFRLALNRDQYPVTFDVDLFTEYFSTQSNKLILLDASGRLYPGSREVLLTSRRKQWSFDLNDPDFSGEHDDYSDTDGDGISDFAEFAYGWDPFDPRPSPGQTAETADQAAADEAAEIGANPTAEPGAESETAVRPETTQTVSIAHEREEQTVAPDEPANLFERYRVEDPTITRSNRLEHVLDRLARAAKEGFSLGSGLSLTLSVFLLVFCTPRCPATARACSSRISPRSNASCPTPCASS